MKRSIASLRRGGLALVIAIVSLGALFDVLFDLPPVRAAAVAVESTSPADGEVVPTSPAQITITFNQPIGSTFTTVIGCNGNPVPSSPSLSSDLLSLVIDLSAAPLPKGTCDVRWSVIGIAAGVVESDTFSFEIEQDTVATTAAVVVTVAGTVEGAGATVASTPAATGDAASGTTGTAGDSDEGSDLGGPLGLARLVSMLTVAILFGSLVLITVAWPEGVEYILTIRFIRLTWIAALAGTVLMVVCLTAQASGKGFTGSLNPTTWSELKDSTPGIAALARVVLVAAIGWVALRPDRAIDPTTQLPALAIPAFAVATMGFSRSGGDLVLIGYAAGVGHALAMAVWLGGLVLLVRVVLAGPGEDDLVHAVRGFGRLATPAMLITVLTGAVQLYRMDSGHLSDTTHGRLMLFKVVPVIAMVVIGTATRQFVHARMSRAEAMTAPLASRLRRAVGFEAMLGVFILAITSWMLSTQPANLVAGARSSEDFAEQQEFVDAAGTLDAKLSLDPARVGTNELLLEIRKPVADISQIVIQFTPPQSAINANPVTMTITTLTGAGAAHLDRDIGLPLNAAGAWNVTLEITTPAGVLKQNTLLNVRADGNTSDLSILPTGETAVTSTTTLVAPTTVPPG